MALGLIPQAHLRVELKEINAREFLALAIEAIRFHGWHLSHLSETELVAYTDYSWRSRGEDLHIKIEDEQVQMLSACVSVQITDWGKNKHNLKSIIEMVRVLRTRLSADQLQEKIDQLEWASHLPSEGSHLSNSKNRLSKFWKAFVPTRGYWVTPVLIYANTLLFTIMVISGVYFLDPTVSQIQLWGGNNPYLTLHSDWWRLFTSIFLHFGFWHLVANLYALIFIGILLEPLVKSWRFGLAYLLTGLIASLTSTLSHESYVVAAGASGAIFGLYGVFLALMTTKLVQRAARRSLLTSIGIFVLYNIWPSEVTTDHAAHFGGFLSGMVFGYCLYISMLPKRSFVFKQVSLALSSILIFLSLGLVYYTAPVPKKEFPLVHALHADPEYESELKSFKAMELMALEIYDMFSYKSQEELLDEIDNRSLYYWKECRKLAREMSHMTVDPNLQNYADRLVEYCDLRMEAYRELRRLIETDAETSAAYEQYEEEIYQLQEELNIY